MGCIIITIYIDTMTSNVSIIPPKGRSYYLENREEILSIANRKYREDPGFREMKKNYSIEYQRKNQEHYKEYLKLHYQKNKEKILERRAKTNIATLCSCGKNVLKTNQNKHLKTKYHLKRIPENIGDQNYENL